MSNDESFLEEISRSPDLTTTYIAGPLPPQHGHTPAQLAASIYDIKIALANHSVLFENNISRLVHEVDIKHGSQAQRVIACFDLAGPNDLLFRRCVQPIPTIYDILENDEDFAKRMNWDSSIGRTQDWKVRRAPKSQNSRLQSKKIPPGEHKVPTNKSLPRNSREGQSQKRGHIGSTESNEQPQQGEIQRDHVKPGRLQNEQRQVSELVQKGKSQKPQERENQKNGAD